MYRLKILSLMITMILVASLAACSLLPNSSGGGRVVYIDADSVADARFEQVLEAIETKDAEMLKSLFSEKALSEAEDIDENIENLFNLIEGDLVSWEQEGWGTSESMRSGKKSRQIQSWYILVTTENEYRLFFLDFDNDTLEPHNQGLYTLRAILSEDKEKHFTTWQDMEIPGVFIPEEYSNLDTAPES